MDAYDILRSEREEFESEAAEKAFADRISGKVESDQEDEEAARYRSSLINELMNDPKFWYGVSVRGYDTDLPVDEVETVLKEVFSDCGEITHFFVDTLDKQANVYFSLQDGEARALRFDGIILGGFELDISPVASVLNNRPSPLDNGEICFGYTVPAHMIEFANKKVVKNKAIAFKKQRRS